MNLNGKSPMPLWVPLCICVVAIAGVYLAAKTLLAPQPGTELATALVSTSASRIRAPTQENFSPTGIPPSAAAFPSPSLEMTSSTVRQTTGQRSYRNQQYGFGFNYEEGWGDIQVAETSSSSREYTPGLQKPDTGAIFKGTFSNHTECGFGAITPDYSYPSEKPLFVSAGYRENRGHYFSLWPDPSIQHLVGVYSEAELTPSSIRIIASSSSRALILEYRDQFLESTILEAEINLRNSIFRGLSIGCILSDNDTRDQVTADRQGIDVILSTFSYAF
jgi:hypothetical protein